MVERIEIEELNSVLPLEAAAYLQATGWIDSGAQGPATVWSRRVGDSNFRVLLPDSRDLLDYPARIHDLISAIATVEQRAREEVLYDLRYPLLDVQHIRTTAPTPSGTTGLRDGYQAVKGVHDLFLAATASAMPQQEARDFVRTVRLGPTGKGSFVLRVETPLQSSPTESGVRARDVLLHLYRAVSAAHAAAVDSVRTDTLTAFEDHIDKGVSANLCKALAEIGGPDKRAFDMSFSWAKTMPVEEPTPEISFDGQQIETLKKADKYLRDLATTQTATIRGTVTNLSNKAPGRQGGKVTVEGLLTVEHATSERQRVSVHLPLHLYELAVEAHGSGRTLVVTGRLKDSGRTPEIVNVTHAEIG